MENIARKERRRLNETKRFRKVKRSAALVGTAMVGCSVAAPLIQPVQADADQTPHNSVPESIQQRLLLRLLRMHNQLLKPTIYMPQS